MDTASPTADQVIELLGLMPLEGEGGYYRQTHIQAGAGPDGDQTPATTAILFLVTPEAWSGLHRLTEDELFHFYLGDPCSMITCTLDGTVQRHVLGHDLAGGAQVQTLVPAGTWQGTMLKDGGVHGFALLGTTMTPGFRADQFELATEANLINFAPEVAALLQPFLASQQERA